LKILAAHKIIRPEHFGPTRRIRKRREIVGIQGSSQKKLHSKFFVIAVNPASRMESRLAITITKKVEPLATKRNYLKRVVREVFRQNCFRFVDNFDMVVIAKRGANLINYHEIKLDILSMLDKVMLDKAKLLAPTTKNQ